jgi:hypothetical protein
MMETGNDTRPSTVPLEEIKKAAWYLAGHLPPNSYYFQVNRRRHFLPVVKFGSDLKDLLRVGGFDWEPAVLNAVHALLMEHTARRVVWLSVARGKKEREFAIRYLLETIPGEEWDAVCTALKTEGREWLIMQHHGFGMWVRNLLREGGFDWDATDLDDVWIEFVDEALRRRYGRIRYWNSRNRPKKYRNRGRKINHKIRMYDVYYSLSLL